MYELVVLGGGPAGLAAALEAWKQGVRRIAVIERDRELGGILNQCIHPGFGLQIFKEELTGPEYAQRFIDELSGTQIEIVSDTMVLDWTSDSVCKRIQVVSPGGGWRQIETESIILSMGCRERTRGAIAIPGGRPSGIFTAGTAQRLLNREGYMVGRRVVILGSGDIGLIMARRLTLEGAKVLAVAELMPYSNGLVRNIVQCLRDFDIPLLLSHTVVDIVGSGRVEKVVLAQVDEQLKPIPETRQVFECDTLLLSVGLIPENELSVQAGIEIDPKTSGPIVTQDCQTSQPGVFACGNVLHVHDLVDFVTQEARLAGRGDARYLQGQHEANRNVSSAVHSEKIVWVRPGQNINYVVPQKLTMPLDDDRIALLLRVSRPGTNKEIQLWNGHRLIKKFRKERVAPAEMERLVVSKSELDNVTGEINVVLADTQTANAEKSGGKE